MFPRGRGARAGMIPIISGCGEGTRARRSKTRAFGTAAKKRKVIPLTGAVSVALATNRPDLPVYCEPTVARPANVGICLTARSYPLTRRVQGFAFFHSENEQA